MARIDIHYPQATHKERTAAALIDCKRHLGPDYELIVSLLRKYWQDNADQPRAERYKGMCFSLAMFVGIEGYYPYRAMWRAALTTPVPLPKAGKPHLTLILTGAMRTIDMDKPKDGYDLDEFPDDDAIDLDAPDSLH